MKTFAILVGATLVLANALPAFADHGRFGRKSLVDIDANIGGHRGQVASVDANVKGAADIDIDVGGNRGGRGYQRDYNNGCNTGCNNGNDDHGWKQQRGGNGSLVDVDVNSAGRGRSNSLVDLDVNTASRGRSNSLIDLDVNAGRGRGMGASRGGLLDLDLNLGGQSRSGNYGRRSTGCNNGCDFGGGVGN